MSIRIRTSTAPRQQRRRNQVIYSNQYGTLLTSQDARRAMRDLRNAPADTALDDATAARARAQVAEIDATVHAPEPDKR